MKSKRNSFLTSTALQATIVISLCASPFASALNQTWVAAPTDALWPTAANWSGAAAPGAINVTGNTVNPDVVFCHVSSYGPQGPRADWPGYDQLFQASCGWEVMGAGEGNDPMWHRFGFMDHLCAMSSVAGTLMALLVRDTTGRPSDVAASLLGAGVLTNSETYGLPDGSLAPVPMLDQSQTMVGPGSGSCPEPGCCACCGPVRSRRSAPWGC